MESDSYERFPWNHIMAGETIMAFIFFIIGISGAWLAGYACKVQNPVMLIGGVLGFGVYAYYMGTQHPKRR